MKKEDVQPGMRVKVPETFCSVAQVGIVDQRDHIGTTGRIFVGVHGGSLWFDAEDIELAT